jgi:hypothetical protein
MVHEDLVGVLEPHELEGVMGARHKPNYVLQVMIPRVLTMYLLDPPYGNVDIPIENAMQYVLN